MKKMLITLLLAISTGSHATVLKNATDTFPLVSLQQKKVNDNTRRKITQSLRHLLDRFG